MGVRAWILLSALAVLACIPCVRAAPERNFTIANDRFVLDGAPMQIISSSIHYFRILPAQWEDRLLRLKSMGMNTIQTYVAWNVHEPYPGDYVWDGQADVIRFIELAQKAGLLVLLRPGPYICAEWDFGGFPAWLSSTQIAGGGKMGLRSHDPEYLQHVDRWLSVLLPKVAPYVYSRGGPIIMVQVENEFGYAGPNPKYMQHLTQTFKSMLPDGTILYTTDPPSVIKKGGDGLPPGQELFSAVDFGTNWYTLDFAFGQAQKSMNAPGKSPPICTEYYAGWLTGWGQKIQNQTLGPFISFLEEILAYGNSTGSVNLYMGIGGTNFGYNAGADIYHENRSAWQRVDDNSFYTPFLTSYDYDAPLSEGGLTGQPGTGGPNKFLAVRNTIAKHTGQAPAALLSAPPVAAYGALQLNQQVALTAQLGRLYSGDGIVSQFPRHMEEYGQRGGLILYRTRVPAALLANKAVLNFSNPIHDAATVLLDGAVQGLLERNNGFTLSLGPLAGARATSIGDTVLDVVVEAMGRANMGTLFDFKGLTSPNVTLNGTLLMRWNVFPLPLDNLHALCFPPVESANATIACSAAPAQQCTWAAQDKKFPEVNGPVFYRGTWDIAQDGFNTSTGYPPDTYLSVKGWSKGLAFLNGFNLGYYWPAIGPANTLYVPGPLLKPCNNELILLELHSAAGDATVHLSDRPDFHGPPSHAAAETVSASQRQTTMDEAFRTGKYGGHLIK